VSLAAAGFVLEVKGRAGVRGFLGSWVCGYYRCMVWLMGFDCRGRKLGGGLWGYFGECGLIFIGCGYR